MSTFASKSKRYQGTYRSIPKVEWTVLLAKEFGSPKWEELYPVHPDKGVFNEISQSVIYTELSQKSQILSPRMACKLFHDGLYLIKKADETPKFIQDRIPEACHKCFKKKQWRKQFFEGMRRVCCRLSIGLGFRPNCVAEDAFIHAILGISFELGWRRIAEFIDCLPEWEKDRDFSRVAKFAANEDVGNLLRGLEQTTTKAKDNKAAVDISKVDVKVGWFRCYDLSANHMFDHIVKIDDDETDDWSATTGSTVDSIDHQRIRSDSVRSDISAEWTADGSSIDSEDQTSPHNRARSGSNLSPSRRSKAVSLEGCEENAIYFTSSIATADATMAQVITGLKIKQ